MSNGGFMYGGVFIGPKKSAISEAYLYYHNSKVLRRFQTAAATRRKWRFIGHQQFGCPKGAVYTTELRWEFRQKPAALALLYCKQIATRLFSTFSSRNWPINSKWAREKIAQHLFIKSGYLNCIRSAATAQDSSYFVSTPFVNFLTFPLSFYFLRCKQNGYMPQIFDSQELGTVV